MKNRYLVPGLLFSLATVISSTALATGEAGLAQLATSEGTWVYHGRLLGDAKTPATDFVWHADCRWSANRAFMMCSFANIWGGKHINSLVVDTFNRHDKAFWHYEIFNDDGTPGKPFASKMQIDGATRSEEWTENQHGKSVRQRIVYTFASVKKVAVSFEQSEDGKAWKTTASGTGEKTGS
ncbi:MAG TPA: hypothetical protein VGF97_05015 [Rhizomicrobium sp.]|jgi:hypothetical protein